MKDFKFHCPHCGRRLKSEPKLCGRQIKCPACAGVLTVPISPEFAMPPNAAGGIEPSQDVSLGAVWPGVPGAHGTVYWRRKEPPTSSPNTAGLPDEEAP